jgi:hypothetical protein
MRFGMLLGQLFMDDPHGFRIMQNGHSGKQI